MTTHLTHDGDSLAPGDEEEPELVLIDDDEFEAAHRDDEAFDEVDDIADVDEPEFSFEDDLEEAIALDMSDEMDPGVEDADERMAPLFSSQHAAPDPSDLLLTGEGGDSALGDGTGDGDSAAALAVLATSTASAAPALSKQEARAEEKRQREALKRRKEIDKAASQDEKERQRDEKAAAAAAERAAVAAQKETAEAEKREAAEAEKQAAADKKQAAKDEKQAAAEAKARQAEEMAEQKAEAKRSRAEAKESRAEAKRTAKRREEPIVPAGLTSFVVDEEPKPAATPRRKDAQPKKQGMTRAPIVTMIVVLLAVAGVAAYAMNRSNPKATPAPRGAAHANAVPAALASMISANTADIVYAQHIGGPIPADVNGGGSVDLATQGSNLSVTYSMERQKFPEQIIYDGSQAFYDLGAITRYVTPAYKWVSADLAANAPGSPGVGVGGVLADPSALVSVVQASAPSAKAVGSLTLDGVPVTEYSITLDQAAVTHLLATPGLPAYVHAATYTQLDAQVYVDRSGHVARIVARGTYPELGVAITASTTLDLSHYGTPVSVAPPPPAQVVSEQQFQASADRLAHAPTS